MKPNLPSSLSKSDKELAEWFNDAKRRGYSCCLMDEDANLLDLGNWFDRQHITADIAGTQYLEWMDPEHIPGFMLWVHESDAPNPFTFRFIVQTKAGPRMKYCAIAKMGEEKLRLLIGTTSWTPPPEDRPPGSDTGDAPADQGPVGVQVEAGKGD